jgi:hypothetical protein
MPEKNDSGSNVEKLSFEDHGIIYYGVRTTSLDVVDLIPFYGDLAAHIRKLSRDFSLGGVRQFDGGKHGTSVYLVYDPYENLLRPKVLRRGWD